MSRKVDPAEAFAADAGDVTDAPFDDTNWVGVLIPNKINKLGLSAKIMRQSTPDYQTHLVSTLRYAFF